MIKTFEQFVNENYLDSPSDPEIMDFDFKKMKKNGYTEVTVKKGIEDLEKGEKVAIQKQNLKVEESEDESDSDVDNEDEDTDEDEE